MVAATSTKIALQCLLVLVWIGLRGGKLLLLGSARTSDVFKM